MNSSAFKMYSTPPEFAAYSPQYFARLTFRQAAELDYPTISTPKSIVDWEFTDIVPTTAYATIITPGEAVPHAQDLLPITREMEKAFSNGARSVSVTTLTSKTKIRRVYHFSKVSLLYALIQSR